LVVDEHELLQGLNAFTIDPDTAEGVFGQHKREHRELSVNTRGKRCDVLPARIQVTTRVQPQVIVLPPRWVEVDATRKILFPVAKDIDRLESATKVHCAVTIARNTVMPTP
jgi:hypothetical protein